MNLLAILAWCRQLATNLLALGGTISISPLKINTALYTWVINLVFHTLVYNAIQVSRKPRYIYRVTFWHFYAIRNKTSLDGRKTRASGLIIHQGVFKPAYQLVISLVWLINVTLIPSLSVMISRDCLGGCAFNNSFFVLFANRSQLRLRKHTQDEGRSGCFHAVCGIYDFLFGVRLPETVHLWWHYSVQGKGLDDLEENITGKHHKAVSRQNLFARIAQGDRFSDIRTCCSLEHH